LASAISEQPNSTAHSTAPSRPCTTPRAPGPHRRPLSAHLRHARAGDGLTLW
jgi:hypothetical protein